jgi:hypothetical protein
MKASAYLEEHTASLAEAPLLEAPREAQQAS